LINIESELFSMSEYIIFTDTCCDLSPELLKQWGVPETYRGVGHCILGYAEGAWPAPKPRKEGRIIRP
jgi:hypothetical protein